MNEIGYLQKCVELIENKLHWTKNETILHSDFKSLRDDIKVISGIEVSLATLKRVFGRKKTFKTIYNPQLHTKDALSNISGLQKLG